VQLEVGVSHAKAVANSGEALGVGKVASSRRNVLALQELKRVRSYWGLSISLGRYRDGLQKGERTSK
jgi:hypothetical protein